VTEGRHIDFAALANSTVIVTAVGYGVLLQLAALAGLFGFLLWLLVTLSLWRYGYSVLRHVASGWNHFPPPDVESTNPFGELAVVFHSALFAVLIYMLATTPFVEGVARWLALFAVLAVFPASAAIMAMTRNLAAAFGPANVANLVRELGADYVKLLGVSFGLGAFMVIATRLADASFALGVLREIVSVWAVLGLFLATGATVRAHRADFDLVEGVDDADERRARERREAWQRTLDRAYASVRSGLAPQGYRIVKELIASEHDSLEIYQWTFNGMLAWHEPRHAAMLGERFTRKLWDAGRKVDALELAQRCRRLSSEFNPPAPFTAELVAYARSLGRHRIADELAAPPAAAGGA
jgi:hypothetical protein